MREFETIPTEESRIARLLPLLFSILTISISTLSHAEGGDEKDQNAPISLFEEVYRYILRYHISPPPMQELIKDGIEGMLKGIDPYSKLLTPQEVMTIRGENIEKIGTTGIVVEKIRERFFISKLSEKDGTSVKIGLKVGDEIIAIDGKEVKGLSLQEVKELLTGPASIPVSLSIRRGSGSPTVNYTVIRSPLRWTIDGGGEVCDGRFIFPIRVFYKDVSKDFIKRLRDIEKKTKVKGIVLDIRDNPGGLLEEAISFCDIFLKKGIITRIRDRNSAKELIYSAKEDSSDIDTPVVLLVSPETSSSAELFALALQENKRATVIGLRTFGKNSIQKIIKLSDGSGLKLTVAYFYSPEGRSIEGIGVIPDIVVHKRIPYSNELENEDPYIKKACEFFGARGEISSQKYKQKVLR